MKHINISFITILFLSFTPIINHAGDIENGERLHMESCISCHQTELYQRPESQIQTLEQLHNRVQQCELANDLAWFEEEVDDVTEYLNVYYYSFGRK